MDKQDDANVNRSRPCRHRHLSPAARVQKGGRLEGLDGEAKRCSTTERRRPVLKGDATATGADRHEAPDKTHLGARMATNQGAAMRFAPFDVKHGDTFL